MSEEESSEAGAPVPFIAIGANELGDPLGDTIKCPICGETHTVEHSQPIKTYGALVGTPTVGKLSFYKCGDTHYLIGIDGRKIK